MSKKSSRGNGFGARKARKAKGGQGLSATKRAKINGRKERVAALDDLGSVPKHRHSLTNQ